MKSTLKNAIESHGMKVYGNLVTIDGELFPLPLVQGNEKLGPSVWHASTLPTNETITAEKDGRQITEHGTCPTTCRGCYGTLGNYQFNSVKYALIMRTRLLREHMPEYFQLVRCQLQHESIEKLRIHATGDFIPGEAAGYAAILADFPHVSAWTYTKCSYSDELKTLDSLENMNIVKSIVPGFGFNFGHVARVANMFYALKRRGASVYICRCGIDKNQHCSNCDGCSSHEYVLFIEHSTGYKPEADYGFGKLQALIESQNS